MKKRGKKISLRHRPLEQGQFKNLEAGFIEWSDLLGKARTTVYTMQSYIHEFLLYLESRSIEQIDQVGITQVRDYIGYLQHRANQRRGGGLSLSTINSHITTIKRFKTYLSQAHGIYLFFEIGHLVAAPVHRTVLTIEEVKSLYAAAVSPYSFLGIRDEVTLDIYYGCGLRRSEGVSLDIKDIDLGRRLVHVRKGKNKKQRYVPFTGPVRDRIRRYLTELRPILEREEKEAFFLNVRGKRLAGQSVYRRLLALQQKSLDRGLRDKKIGVHTLRHSIATHLLQGGMSIEQVAQFLGHRTLRATQIYTHLPHEF